MRGGQGSERETRRWWRGKGRRCCARGTRRLRSHLAPRQCCAVSCRGPAAMSCNQYSFLSWHARQRGIRTPSLRSPPSPSSPSYFCDSISNYHDKFNPVVFPALPSSRTSSSSSTSANIALPSAPATQQHQRRYQNRGRPGPTVTHSPPGAQG